MCEGSIPGAPMFIVCPYAVVTVFLCGTGDLDEGTLVCAMRTQHKLASPEVVVHLLSYTCQGPGFSLPLPLSLSVSLCLSLHSFFQPPSCTVSRKSGGLEQSWSTTVEN